MNTVLFALSMFFSLSLYSQVLPDSKHAYKSVMRIKKTNLCFALSKGSSESQQEDLLSFSFRDFIYDYKKVPDENVKLEVIKILKNYKTCEAGGGLKIIFSIKGKVFKEEIHCANQSYPKNPTHSCFVVEEMNEKKCFQVSLFNMTDATLDGQEPISKKDFKNEVVKKVCE